MTFLRTPSIRMLLVLLFLLTVSVVGAQDSTIAELDATFDTGSLNFQHPEVWDVLDTSDAIIISNVEIATLDPSSLPEGTVVIQMQMQSIGQGLEIGASATEIVDVLLGDEDDENRPVTAEIELDTQTAVQVDLSDDTNDVLVYVATLSDTTYIQFVVFSVSDESAEFVPTVEAILNTLILVVEAPIAEDSFTRYEDIPQGVTEDGFPRLGDPEASVTILEIGSFDCPHCGNFHSDAFPTLLEHVRQGDIQFVYVPLFGTGGIPDGGQAALAAACALDQDAFWTFYDALYDWQDFAPLSFMRDRLVAGAEQLDMDLDEWMTCMNADEFHPAVQAAVDLTQSMGADFRGTPTILVNDVVVPSSLDAITEAINEAQAGE